MGSDSIAKTTRVGAAPLRFPTTALNLNTGMKALEKIRKAGENGDLLEGAVRNMEDWLGGGFLPEWAEASVNELLDKEEWAELNDRFYQYMAFGTGGMRGRTIAGVMTAAEKGTVSASGTPEHPAVGANVLNDFNVIRATLGLYRYTGKFLSREGRFDVPKLVIAHDVRHFSRHFCELAASTWARLGGRAFIFDGPRSTPQLSFSVRYLGATAGIVITASHNPPHDNGYKVYFEDGGQVVEPHAGGIIEEVNSVELKELTPFLEKQDEGVITLPESLDEAYHASAARTVLDPDLLYRGGLKVVFSPIHGTAAAATIPLLEKFNVDYLTVEAQMKPDPAFSTVESPNPENAEALSMAIDLAEKEGADIVVATDPDADRMGVAVRGPDGPMELLTGNQIGSLLAEYRIARYKDLGVLPKDGSDSAALIKTFVTTPMQGAIARGHGLKVINTLTGFKWIGDKIHGYEKTLRKRFLESKRIAIDYDATPIRKRAEMLMRYSTFYVFGGEESYGYLSGDEVRDKDGNSAVLMFCELAAYAKTQNKTLVELMDELYRKYGFYYETLGQIYYEGAAGSEKIKRILDSYRSNPPSKMNAIAVKRMIDFGKDEIQDADGAPIPRQNFYILELANGYSYAVRGSGTEPKIKFYFFANDKAGEDGDLAAVKNATIQKIDELRKAVEADAAARAD